MLYMRHYRGNRWVDLGLIFCCYPEFALCILRVSYSHIIVGRKFFWGDFPASKIDLYILKSFLTRCTVLTDTEHIAAVSRTLLPCFNERITLAYSASFCSIDFTLPTLRPIFTPFSIANFLPLLRRYDTDSRSSCEQTPKTETITARYGFSVASAENKDKPSF